MKRIDSGECKVDISEEELVNRYLNPFKFGEPIVINGTTLDPFKIWRVKITQSEDSIQSIIRKIEEEDRYENNPYKMLQASPRWRAIDKLIDVTDNYIDFAPGSQKRVLEESLNVIDNKKVFIVHGHDIELKNDVELFLGSIGLKPVVLHRELDEGLTIIEKFEKHSEVNYAIILLTPDDIGFTVEESKKPEVDRNIEFRARQNVIFEFGYFIGKLGRRNVCCIFKKGTKLPSDLGGLIYKEVDKSIDEVGLFVMRELKNCGINVKFE